MDKSMIIKDLEPMLRELAEKLGTTSEYLWVVTVKQAYVSATVYFGALGLVLCLLLSMIPLGKYINKEIRENNDVVDDCVLIWVIPSIALGVTFVMMLIIGLSGSVTALFNPEYWALSKILAKIK